MNNQRASDEQIREMLIKLHAELEQTQALDPEERALLRHLMADIQEMLDRPEGATAPDQPRYQPSQKFLNRLQNSIELIEANHPALRVMVEKALDTLNLAGI